MAVVLLSIVAVGVPLSWITAGRKPLDESAWIRAPFLGLAAIILVLQNLVYVDVTIQQATPLLWGIVLLLGTWMYRNQSLGASLAACPYYLFAAALSVYCIQGLGLLVVGAHHYMGKAWGDQFNYTAIAQFLTDERFSSSLLEVGNRPYLVYPIRMKWDRIGQSILHGFFTTSSFSDAKTLFEPTIMLSPALIVVAIYALSRRLGLAKWHALATGVTAGLLPGIAMVHLESFLSHALALPLLLFWPVALSELSERPDWGRLSCAAVFLTAATSIYTEFWILLMGLALLMLGMTAIRHPHAWRLLGCYGALAVSVFVLNPGYVPSILAIIGRVGAPVLHQIYPWAFKLEGLGRIWLGDNAAVPSGIAQSLIRLYAIAMTAMAYYGLTRACAAQLCSRKRAWSSLQQRCSLACAVGVLMLALLPVFVIARDHEHPYQFYKLLLSVSPLFVVGLSLVGNPPRPATASGRVRGGGRTTLRLRIVPALAILGVALVLGAFGTTSMALQTTQLQPTERYNAHYLLAPGIQQLEDQLEALRDGKLFFHQHDATWNTGFVNAWLTYFARHNQVWLGNPRLNDLNLALMPEAAGIIDLNTLPDDLLVLTSYESDFVRPPLGNSMPIWSNSSYQLWKPATRDWAIPIRIAKPSGVDGYPQHPALWLGQGITTLQVLAARQGELRIVAHMQPGHAMASPTPNIRITGQDGLTRTFTVHTGRIDVLEIVVRAGLNTLLLEVLDQPDQATQSFRDARSPSLGLLKPWMTLADNWAILTRIENANGLEQVDGQPFFWIGRGITTLEVLAPRQGSLVMEGTFFPGPSLPQTSQRFLQISTSNGYMFTFMTYGDDDSFTLPVGKGQTSISLLALDQPTQLHQPNGDTRPLLLGVRDLRILAFQ